LCQGLECGGVFHLWGHSWEVQQTGQWQRLDEVLRFMGEFASEAPSLTNGELCQRSPSQIASVDETWSKGETIRSEQ